MAYRQDKGVDIYYTKGLDVDEDDYKSLFNKVTLVELDYLKAEFDAAEKGIDVYCSFRDRHNKNVEFKV